MDADKRHRGGAAGEGQMVNTVKKVYDQNLRDQNFSLQPRVEDYFNKRSEWLLLTVLPRSRPLGEAEG